MKSNVMKQMKITQLFIPPPERYGKCGLKSAEIKIFRTFIAANANARLHMLQGIP
jgi:hypothetical protein